MEYINGDTKENKSYGSIQDIDNSKAEDTVVLSQQEGQNAKNLLHRNYMIIKTSVLVCAWITMGMVGLMTSPTIPDLRDRLGVDMETISLVLGVRSIGTPVGAIISGVLSDRYHEWSDVIGASGLVLMGATFILKPHIYNLGLLGFICFLEGYGNGSMDGVGQAMVVWMWKDKATIPMNAIHMGYPIGAAIAPLVTMNFLKPQTEEGNITTVVQTSTELFHLDSFTDNNTVIWSTYSSFIEPSVSPTEEPVSRIEIPYAIAGILSIITAIVIFALDIYSRKRGIMLYGKSKTSFKDTCSPEGFRSYGNACFSISIIVLVCLFLGLESGGSVGFNSYMFSFATESHLKFTTDEASILQSVALSVGIISRLLCTITSKWIPAHIMMIVSSTLYMVSSICITLLGPDAKIYIWLFYCSQQLFLYPLFPAAMSWSAKHIAYGSLVVGFIQVSVGVFVYICAWISGALYDKYPGGEFMIFGMAVIIAMWFVSVIMEVMGLCHVHDHSSIDDTIVFTKNVDFGSVAESTHM